MKKNFSMIGLAGFVSLRHVKAIKATKNVLLSGIDLHDNVGFLDYYFPKCIFYTRQKDYLNHIKRSSKKIDFISICTPNYQHFKHIKLGLLNNINVICEKPLVLTLKSLDNLKKIQKK